MNGTVTVYGKSGHSAFYGTYINPCTALAKIISKLKSVQLDKGTKYMPPSNLEFTKMNVDNISENVVPQSASAKFNVRFNSDRKQDIEVRVVNLVGELIYIDNLESFKGEYLHSFNLSEYSKGIYLLELDTENGKVHKKMILQ